MLAISSSPLIAFLQLSSLVSSAYVSENFLETLRTPRPYHAVDFPRRNRTCIAESHDDLQTDDADNILKAIQECNNGGHVILAKKHTYTIASPLNLTGLSAVDIDIQGRLSFPADNLTYWQANSFDLQYQNATSFFILGGSGVNIYGGGEVQGHGQKWWDAYAKDKKIKRPVLFAIVGLDGGSVSDIKLRNSPFWHNVIINSTDVVYSGLDLFSTSDNENFEKNTDGWDIYRSDGIVIENSTVTNGDGMYQTLPTDSNLKFDQHTADCVSFKPNSTNILVQNLRCNGTHGISVGSLGQYPARIDYVENILVRNISMFNSSEGARIKVWPDSYSEKSQSLTGGGGRGLVRNVTYDGMFLDNVDYGLTITQCYGQDDEEECFKHPVSLALATPNSGPNERNNRD